MRHLLTAKENVDQRIGDRHFQVNEGQTIELSGKGAEIALATGLFDYGEEVPETPIEKKRAAEKTKVAKLAALAKDELVKKAEKSGIETKGMKKPEIAEALVSEGGK